MKDVEIVALLLLLLEEGPKSLSISALDAEFANRDKAWAAESRIEDEYRHVVSRLKEIAETDEGEMLLGSKMMNQADFYSLFGAISELRRQKLLPTATVMAKRLLGFIGSVGLLDPTDKDADQDVKDYYDAARSASNDFGPRQTRIRILKEVICGTVPRGSSSAKPNGSR